jgi:hypothetical protein
MRVEINEITFLGPYFSRFVRDHCGDESESLIAKKMLPVSACIGASIRHKEMIRLDPDGIFGVRPIILKRRIRYNFDMHVHVELCSYLDRAEEGRWEALVWLAELHAASFYGAVSFGEAMRLGDTTTAGYPARNTLQNAIPGSKIMRNDVSIDHQVVPVDAAMPSRDGSSSNKEPDEQKGLGALDQSERLTRRANDANEAKHESSIDSKDKISRGDLDSAHENGNAHLANDERGSEPFSFLTEMAKRGSD